MRERWPRGGGGGVLIATMGDGLAVPLALVGISCKIAQPATSHFRLLRNAYLSLLS